MDESPLVGLDLSKVARINSHEVERNCWSTVIARFKYAVPVPMLGYLGAFSVLAVQVL